MDTKSDNDKSSKKFFDKKKYRYQKYSNKFKVQKWEDNRKRNVKQNFLKQLSKEDKMNLLQSKNSHSEEINRKHIKGIGFIKAKKEFLKKKNEKQQKKENALKKLNEKNEALQKYKENKLKKFKALSQRTKKGQPLMRDRLKLLLEKIQDNL